MELTLSPGAHLRGAVHLAGDKSLSHRAALFAGMAEGESRIGNFLVSGVTRVMLSALSASGIAWELDGAELRVRGHGLSGWLPPQEPLDCGNSGTTMRMLAGVLAAAGIPAVLDGSPGLRRRPMQRIVEPLQKMGVPIWASAGGGAPLLLTGRPAHQKLQAIDYALPVASAQVKTALILASLAAQGPSRLSEPALSRDHTERMLSSMGVRMEIQPPSEHGLPPGIVVYPLDRPLSPLDLDLPADFSSAAFLIVAALISPGSQVTLKDVGLNPTRTGLLDALAEMGAEITVRPAGLRAGEPVGDIEVTASRLQGTEVSGSLVVRMIDEFPVFAVAAAYAGSPTVVTGAEELRYKESDRIKAITQGLSSLGVEIQELPDGFRIHGQGGIGGGQAQSFGDHRLAMALVISGLQARQPVTIGGAEVITESFPDFTQCLENLGARIHAK